MSYQVTTFYPNLLTSIKFPDRLYIFWPVLYFLTGTIFFDRYNIFWPILNFLTGTIFSDRYNISWPILNFLPVQYFLTCTLFLDHYYISWRRVLYWLIGRVEWYPVGRSCPRAGTSWATSSTSRWRRRTTSGSTRRNYSRSVNVFS